MAELRVLIELPADSPSGVGVGFFEFYGHGGARDGGRFRLAASSALLIEDREAAVGRMMAYWSAEVMGNDELSFPEAMECLLLTAAEEGEG